MKSTDNRLKNLYLFLIIVICSLPVIHGFYYIENYAVDVPYWDQWNSIVFWSIEYYEGDFSIVRLISLQNDSRPLFPNALLMILSLLTDLNIKIMFYFSFVVYAISIAIILYFIKNGTDIDYLTLLLTIPILYYAFNPYYMIRFIHNIGAMQYPIMILTAILTVYLLNMSKNKFLYFLCSILTGFICTFSFAAGLSIWFAGLFQLVIQKMSYKRSKIVIWIMSTVAIFYVYFIFLGFTAKGLHSTSAYSAFFEAFRDYPVQKFLSFMGTLGAQIIHQKEISLYFGFILIIFIAALLYVNRKNLELDRLSKWYSLLVFGSLTSLQLALTRSGADVYFGPSDTIFFIPGARHSLAIFLPIICIYVLSILYTKADAKERSENDSNDFQIFFRERRHLNLFLLGIIFLLISLGSILHVMPGIDGGKSMYNQQVAYLYYLENYEIQPDKNLKNLHPSASYVRERASKLEEYKLSIFSKERIDITNLPKFNINTYTHIDTLNMKIIHLQKDHITIDKTNEDSIEISGWAVDKHANGPAKAVFITIDDELNIPTIYGLDRPDVANAYNNKNYRYSGFRASFASSILDEGPHNFTIKIVSKDGDGYYTSNQIVPFVCV
jgi:hypothetical protein